MWPTFVIGGYAGVDGSTTKYCLAAGEERECIKAGRNITIGARAGTRFGQDSLVYLKGGYSNGQIRDRYTDTAFPDDNYNLRKNMDGFHVGGGVQLGIGHGLYMKGEYTFTQYSTYKLAGYDARIDRHRLAGGVGFHF
jgi:outer membrane immunogenic protein